MNKKKKKTLLYPMDGLHVPLSVIKKAYDGKPYIPPLTQEIVYNLYMQVYNEELERQGNGDLPAVNGL